MKTAGVILTIFLALAALGIGFVGTTAALYLTQPSSKTTTTIRFVVNSGDTTTSVANRLQGDGLIRSALAFRLYARFKHLDQGIQAGIYLLNPTMTMAKIVDKLQHGQPDEQLVTVPDSLRVRQYPQHFTSLPNFNANDFISIMKTGNLDGKPGIDSTALSTKYWFVEKPQKNVFDAMEGYLYPDSYYFDGSADTTKVIETMVEELGAQFCPGPSGNFTQYIDTLADCKQHAATISGKNVFTAMEAAYHTKNDTQAIYDTLIIASLTTREIANYNQAPGIAGVLWTRYAALSNFITNTGAVNNLGSDPTTQYALDNEHPPTDNKWWKPLPGQAQVLAPKDPYNSYSPKSGILPPGPIANANVQVILAAAAPSASKYFYFLADHCGNIHYSQTLTQFNALVTKYISGTACSTSVNS